VLLGNKVKEVSFGAKTIEPLYLSSSFKSTQYKVRGAFETENGTSLGPMGTIWAQERGTLFDQKFSKFKVVTKMVP